MSKPDAADYIIAGAGAAGLSLACRMVLENIPFEKLLLIDSDKKNKPDRTWCFWKKKEERLWCEEAIAHRWNTLELFFPNTKISQPLSPYEYCHIPSERFYALAHDMIQKNTHVSFLQEKIKNLTTLHGMGHVISENNTHSAKRLFNSALRTPHPSKNLQFYQQFLGYFIKCSHTFNLNTVRWMDFRVPQPGCPAFVYVLPFSPDSLLIEFTVFTKELKAKNWFVPRLADYIFNYCNIEKYELLGEEFDFIPMFGKGWKNPFGSAVIPMGIAGGAVKSSTGFSFYFIQKQVDKILQQLKQNPARVDSSITQWRYALYDRALLRFFHRHPLSAPDFFQMLFERNSFQNILRFLHEETSLGEEVKIMNTVRKFFIPI